MAKHDLVTLIPDPRSIKVQSGNSLYDYLQVELWFTMRVATHLVTLPQDSQHCLGIQFADMVAGLVQAHYEDGEHSDFAMVSPRVELARLYFDS